jgi:sterol desaturase/sphingolipid hydroxylase (fatty acid hydroxylase superfamily)
MQFPFSMSEPEIRFAAFASVLVVMGLLEVLIPRRALLHAKGRRWITNLAVIGTSFAVVRGMALLASVIAVPLIALAAAELAGARGWGLLNQVDWPQGLEIALALVVLDFAIWTQHVVTHKVPLLWRLHRVHHADVDIDVTTALRFHPIEIGLSMLYKVFWVLILGPSALAVLMFEIILNACAMFSHSNIQLPSGLDRLVRAVLVTPDMHRVHHSVHNDEHNSNFGFNLSIWDRLFGTYIAQPRDGHDGMTIGLPDYQSEAPTRLLWSLRLPFVGR